MSKIYVFLANGCEEIEALTVVDILRRAGEMVETVSITSDLMVESSHKVRVQADKIFDEITKDADMLVLPGGIPGTPNLAAHEGLMEYVKAHNAAGKWVAAVCAAPTILGNIGLLEGKKATCYPSMMEELRCGKAVTDSVVVDGNIITSRGMGTSIAFGLKMVEVLQSKAAADELAVKIVYA